MSEAAETTEQQRTRLALVLAGLEAAGPAVFLDLCEMLLMLSERGGRSMIMWESGRVLVHFKSRRPERIAPVKTKAKAKAKAQPRTR